MLFVCLCVCPVPLSRSSFVAKSGLPPLKGEPLLKVLAEAILTGIKVGSCLAEAILTGIKVVAFSVKGALAVCPVPLSLV